MGGVQTMFTNRRGQAHIMTQVMPTPEVAENDRKFELEQPVRRDSHLWCQFQSACEIEDEACGSDERPSGLKSALKKTSSRRSWPTVDMSAKAAIPRSDETPEEHALAADSDLEPDEPEIPGLFHLGKPEHCSHIHSSSGGRSESKAPLSVNLSLSRPLGEGDCPRMRSSIMRAPSKQNTYSSPAWAHSRACHSPTQSRTQSLCDISKNAVGG
eukprot:TRINITY_DN112191_c0_g1_i1.p1 TRINITY_DN112191_c0_g1~~TRINITY_DN112191_c0_g1_i1.p1  ORF type:complete len:213 (-),score=21.51 TRINITY_DN112191_c0_g1_i1:202-840(-)